MKKIPKREYTPEFRELAIKRVQAGQSIDAVAKEIGVNHQSI
jgi:transposase-like protein